MVLNHATFYTQRRTLRKNAKTFNCSNDNLTTSSLSIFVQYCTQNYVHVNKVSIPQPLGLVYWTSTNDLFLHQRQHAASSKSTYVSRSSSGLVLKTFQDSTTQIFACYCDVVYVTPMQAPHHVPTPQPSMPPPLPNLPVIWVVALKGT